MSALARGCYADMRILRSNPGIDPYYSIAAAAAARAITATGATIVYGGGRVGLMGVIADAAIEAGGQVIRVMPRSLVEREITHRGLAELHVVESMHDRKTKFAELGERVPGPSRWGKALSKRYLSNGHGASSAFTQSPAPFSRSSSTLTRCRQ